MAQPVEIRNLIRRITLEEMTAGVQPVRTQVNGVTILYHPPILQYRWREKGENGQVAWSEWVDVLFDQDDQ